MTSDDENDPYLNPATPLPHGENSITIDDEGRVSKSVEHKLPDERPNTWKDAKKIAAMGDDTIQEYPPRQRSGIVDYRIGNVSVSWRGQGWGEDRQYLCHTHVVNDCPHTRRIHRWRKEHGR